ncbi:isocyanide synthase family protein [Hymenobacter rubripertinctus]|uniref:TetR family transcriptional regulator n=1 Tax=Hymenobacter rubripertinctus TaxID=2029981 RepID=A0A418R4Y6_9BACT|nr:isocyanide synthase family protein [Hymenobacter rubripertinctus]RIY12466.1 TetR family transcriptional regulator [Hymenobacter rubripertinctus]
MPVSSDFVAGAAFARRHHLLATGLGLFAARGFRHVSVAAIAEAAGADLAEVYRFFGSTTDFVLALYQQIQSELETRATDLPTGPVAGRFQQLLSWKLALLEPHRLTLRGLAANLLDADDAVGVLSPETETIRLRGLALFELLVRGATDAPAGPAGRQLATTLYAAHWPLLLLRLLDRTAEGQATTQALALLSGGLGLLPAFRQTLLGPLVLGQAEALVNQFMGVRPEVSFDVARQVLRLLMRRRKMLPVPGHEACAADPCEQCLALHLPRVQYFVGRQQPVHLILPAFPAKSPNRRKVLGELPDLGEEIALITLQTLCHDIRQVYAPGARISICADGRVFADLVQVSDEAVSAYNQALKAQLARLAATDLDVVNLEDLLPATSFDAARAWITERYAEPLAELKQRVQDTEHHRSLFNGIHRFVTEDGQALEPEKSKSRVKEEAKQVAYEVIRRSNAWTRLLAEVFPQAVRLSIHPHHPHADKIGLRITRAQDDWLTPWHGVVLLRDNDYVLLKRYQAEELGAELVEKNGRPSHFVLGPDS